ncbi:MAG TPA: hypothetical protein VE398_13615 [Acidobacteriota bacterium]|nr:hypothetical protein [Acidobacteriota bacterium]
MVRLMQILFALIFLPILEHSSGPGSPAAAPRLDAWKVLGPGGGGAQFLPTVSPHNPKCVLVACDMTGAYISQDGGDSWRMFNLRAPVRFFVFDPVDSQVIYAASAGLWRSEDAGRTWNLVFPRPKAVERLEMADDHGGARLASEGGSYPTITALAVDPADSHLLYAAISVAGEVSLQVSEDGGTNWKKDAPLPGGARKIYVDPRSPSGNRRLYVVGRNSVAVREDGNWSQGTVPPGVEAFIDVSGGFPHNGWKLVLYASTPSRKGRGNRLYVSDDGGQSWWESGLGPASTAPETRFPAIATCLTNPDVAYVSYSNLRNDPADREAFFGVARTADGGKSWKPVWKESRTPAANLHDVWITERFGPGWGENPLNLGISPVNPDICYGTDYGRTMRTVDGGATWQGVYSRKTPEGSYTTTGLDVTTNYGVHFDPFDKQRVFISYTDIGLFRSEDGGASWISASEGVPKDWVNTTYWVEFDPAVKGRMWAVMSGTHDLPRPKMWRRASPQTYRGGVCLSEDGGKSWRNASTNLPQIAATHILLDPSSTPDARVLYVTGFGKGVFKSSDGGRTWAMKNQGLDGREPFAWRLARDRRGVLYLVVARRSEDGSFGNESDGALYRSTDAAEHWQRIQLPKGLNGPNGIAVDPDNPARLSLAAWGRNTGREAVQGGIFVSGDAGESWRNMLSRDQHIYDVTIDPRDHNLYYACGFESSAWRSTDRGGSWQRIRGYNFKWGHRVVPDPYNPAMIFITTFGGSVWYGPAAGDGHAVEDIVTPELAYK